MFFKLKNKEVLDKLPLACKYFFEENPVFIVQGIPFKNAFTFLGKGKKCGITFRVHSTHVKYNKDNASSCVFYLDESHYIELVSANLTEQELQDIFLS